MAFTFLSYDEERMDGIEYDRVIAFTKNKTYIHFEWFYEDIEKSAEFLSDRVEDKGSIDLKHWKELKGWERKEFEKEMGIRELETREEHKRELATMAHYEVDNNYNDPYG